MFLLFFVVEFFSYTSHAVFFFNIWAVSLAHSVLASFLSGEFPLHTPCFFFCILFVVVFLSGDLLLQILCWLHFYVGSLSYTARAGSNFIRGLSRLLHSSCWLHFYCGSFSYTSRAVLIFMQAISHMLPSFLRREFVWHIPCCLRFYAGSFSYTSHVGFFLCGEFLLHIPSWLLFMWGVCITDPELTSLPCREFLLHIPCWLLFCCCCWCEELLSSAVYSEDSPLIKELGGSWTRRKLRKSHTQAREKALEQAE